MATEKGVWTLQEVRDKQLASEWEYNGNYQLWSWGQGEWIGSPVSPNNQTIVTSPQQISATYGNAWQLEKFNGHGTQNSGSIKNGELWVWGKQSGGQMGQNAGTGGGNASQSPIQVGTDNNWAYYATGGTLSLGTKTDGTLWAWGYGQYGGLGINASSPNIRRSSPVQVGTDTTWSTSSTALAASLGTSSAIKTDGTLWIWGAGGSGQLGDNSAVNKSSPTQIPGTTWKMAAPGDTWTMAIKTDGTLWGWGSSASRGGPSPGARSSPIQVGTDTNWAYVNAGQISSMAVKTDGTLWAWGTNTHGQLGQNNRTASITPKQVGTETTWSTTSRPFVVDQGSGAIKQDGTLWMWGDNEHGEVGQAPNDGYSSPTQVGTDTTWIFMTGAQESVLASKDAP